MTTPDTTSSTALSVDGSGDGRATTMTLPEPPGWAPRLTFTSLSRARKAFNRIGIILFNDVITWIPSHTIRQGFLRLWGAKIGKNTSILRGCHVFDIDQLRIGENCSIGFRVLFDARCGIAIGDNVVIASDTQIIAGHHDPQSPTFEPVLCPVRIGDYAWLATRSTILGGNDIGRGAVIGACSLVNRSVYDLEMAAGVPARFRAARDPDALQYTPIYRPLFY